MVSSENQPRKIKTPLKDIFTSEKVEHHPRPLPPRRDVVWKMRLRLEPQKEGSQRHFPFNFSERNTALNIPNRCSEFFRDQRDGRRVKGTVIQTQETAGSLSPEGERLLKHNPRTTNIIKWQKQTQSNAGGK